MATEQHQRKERPIPMAAAWREERQGLSVAGVWSIAMQFL